MADYILTNNPNEIGGVKSTKAGTFDPVYASHSTELTDYQQPGVAIPFDETWIHFDYYIENVNATNQNTETGKSMLLYSDGAPNPLFARFHSFYDYSRGMFALRNTNASYRNYDSNGVVKLGNSPIPFNTLGTVDIRIVKNPDNNGKNIHFEFYWNGALVAEYKATGLFHSFSGSSSSVSGLSFNPTVFTYGGDDYLGDGKFAYVSNLRVSDVDTRGSKFRIFEPNAAGNYDQFEGTMIDPQGIGAIYSDAAGERQSATIDGSSIPGGSVISSVSVISNVRNTGPNPVPSKLDAFLRIGGTDYDQGASIAGEAKKKTLTASWTLNPATGLAWTAADLAALEFGLKSVT